MQPDLAEDKCLAIVGFGIEGYGTYKFIRSRYPTKRISILDESLPSKFNYPEDSAGVLHCDSKASVVLGPTAFSAICDYDIIVKAPGIPLSHPAILAARERNITITTHMELFFEQCPHDRIVGVTGTKGKSTTTSLLYEMVRAGGFAPVLGGNIGSPPLPALMSADHSSPFILELSSYQLEPLRASPHLAVLLDIVPEHLSYHGSFEAYRIAKENITSNQGGSDILIYNADHEIPAQIASRTKARTIPFSTIREVDMGGFIVGNEIVFREGANTTVLADVTDVTLRGRFNLQNVLAAASAAAVMGVNTPAIRKAIRDFRPLPHRLEFVGRYRGIEFFDDSISTVPEATIAALQTLAPTVHTLILGGYDRGLSFDDFATSLLEFNTEVVIFFPTTGERIWTSIVDRWLGVKPLPRAIQVESMRDAVRASFRYTPAGKICLLSPASPSFGVFRDYRDRGMQFRSQIVELDESLDSSGR